MKISENKTTVKEWEKNTLKLARFFIKKYYQEDYKLKYKKDYYFIDNEIGDVFYVADHYWNFKDMVTAIKYNIPEDILFAWYDDTLKKYELGKDDVFDLLRYYKNNM